MTEWILVPCLDQLRREFDIIAPSRDRTSDGTIGDKAHADRVSDHNPDETGAVPIRDADRTNEVHALDVDVDLHTPGLPMEDVVQFLVRRCRSGAERRLRYIIYNRRIWEARLGWAQMPYAGANPHDKHAHFSASYDTVLEASIAPWGLAALLKREVEPMALSQADIDAIWSKDINASPTASNLAYTTVFSTFQTVNSVAATASAGALSAANAAAAVDFLAGDFPGDGDPEDDPIVKRLRYVLANPVPPTS